MTTWLMLYPFLRIPDHFGYLSGVSAPPPPVSPPPAPAKAYIASFQWPITVCSTNNCTDKKDPLPESFKLHGLWPTAPSWYPSLVNCTGGDKFSGNVVKPFRQDLVKYWPSYFMRENAFWEYEWNKHGRCSGMPVQDYFKEGVRLTKLHSPKLLNGLAKSAIRPGSYSATPDAIRNAIETNLGVRSQLTCAKTGTEKLEIFWLKEIHLCMDQTFNIQDCPTTGWLDHCGKNSASGSTKIKFPNN
ncbi:uncharacterized protein LOC141611297 isoform X2 [Silene latifolia]|uniref:uncharacterized protein LOC141611297 isoform X2 n=1 Tax=Silene latifolia TaxID=37657 RepID=UPI003D77E0DC